MKSLVLLCIIGTLHLLLRFILQLWNTWTCTYFKVDSVSGHLLIFHKSKRCSPRAIVVLLEQMMFPEEYLLLLTILSSREQLLLYLSNRCFPKNHCCFWKIFGFSVMDTLELEPVQERGERVNIIIIIIIIISSNIIINIYMIENIVISTILASRSLPTSA